LDYVYVHGTLKLRLAQRKYTVNLRTEMKRFRIQFSAGCGENCYDSEQGTLAAVVKTVMIQDRVQWRL